MKVILTSVTKLCEKNDDIPKFNKHAEENGEEKLKEYVPVEINKTQFDEICSKKNGLCPNNTPKLDVEKYPIEKLITVKK